MVEEELEKNVSELRAKSFEILRFSAYARFDIRVDEKDGSSLLFRLQSQHGFRTRDQPNDFVRSCSYMGLSSEIF